MRAHRQTARSVLTRSKKVVTSVFSHIKKQSHVRLAQLDTTLSKNKYYRSYANFIYKFSNTQLFKRVGVVVLVMAFMFAYLVRPVSAIQTWNQTDWSGGVGTSTSNQYSSASNIDNSISGHISLSKGSNLFANPTFNSNIASWNGANITQDTATKYSGAGSAKIQAPASSSVPFNGPTSIPLPAASTVWQQMDTADFNGDGVDDIVVAGGSARNISVYLSDGQGGWSTPISANGLGSYDLYDVVAGDFNGDGLADAVASYSQTTNFSVFINNGSGNSFTRTEIAGPVAGRPCAIAKGDFNKDTRIDLVFTCYVWGNATVYLGDGSGNFPNKSSYALPYANTYGQFDLTVLDINGDGYDDIATPTTTACAIVVLVNNSGLGFSAYTSTSISPCSGSGGGWSLNKANLNNDQYDDLVFGFTTGSSAPTYTRYVGAMLGSSSGVPTSQANYPALSSISSADADVEAADFNGDGFEDVVASGPSDNQYSLYINNGDGTLAPKIDIATGTYPNDMTIGDYDADGKPDLSVVNRTSGSISTYINKTDGTVLSQLVNVGDTASYAIKAYVYTDGGTVTSSDVTLYAGSSALATTFTNAGGGWYELSATVTGINELNDYGVQAQPGKTVYVDDMELYKYSSPGVLTSSIFDLGFGGDWGTLTYDSTGSGVEVKVRTGNSADMSNAPDFSTCPVLNSGDSLSGQTCMTNNYRYVQYQITLTATAGVTPIFSDITISYLLGTQIHRPRTVQTYSCTKTRVEIVYHQTIGLTPIHHTSRGPRE